MSTASLNFQEELIALQGEIVSLLGKVERPCKALVTAGMPYANGPLHIGHLAGAHLPADIYARWLKLLIGQQNVLFVCGTDDHGTVSQLAAQKADRPIREFVDSMHRQQSKTLQKYAIGLDIYTGTSRPEVFEEHKNDCRQFLCKLYDNHMLEKKNSEQWFDPEVQLFLPGRYVFGNCPQCGHTPAYSEECDSCGSQYLPRELQNPKSSISDSTPVLKKTGHWYLDMWKATDQLKKWIESKQKVWRKNILLEVMNNVHPSIIFSNTFEKDYRSLKSKLPSHKSRYAPGKKIIIQFQCLDDLGRGRQFLQNQGIDSELCDSWAHRSITRDCSWGVPVLEDKDAEMEGKTLYVWPESLIAPISFTRAALKNKGLDPQTYRDFWNDPKAKVYQFIGQDNVFFYVLMQGAMWLGTQADPLRLPRPGELQLTEIFSNCHLQIDGAKMSKSKGNFYTGDQLIDEMGYGPDQLRYFMALLSLPEKNSNFDFETLKERNNFLAGPLNAAFEKPISAAHAQFGGKVPAGKLIGKTARETRKIIQNYLRLMPKAEYAKILFMLENYARLINGLFAQYKPHDDRFDKTQRENALYSSFFVLKNVMIMLSPFVPSTMERLRQSLNLPSNILNLEELAQPFPAGHAIGKQEQYFPPATARNQPT